MKPDLIPGTDDARVENSPVRHAYRVLTDEEKDEVAAIKDAGQAMLDLLAPYQTREAALARTKVEEAVMWAVRGITA